MLQIQGKEFQLTPLPLRTVRPFVLEEVVLADEEGVDLNDQMEITKFLKAKVNALIDQANQLWDERNDQAMEDGEPELPRMLPLVRLKVDIYLPFCVFPSLTPALGRYHRRNRDLQPHPLRAGIPRAHRQPARLAHFPPLQKCRVAFRKGSHRPTGVEH